MPDFYKNQDQPILLLLIGPAVKWSVVAWWGARQQVRVETDQSGERA